MGSKSAIEWTNSTWNVITGCDKVSPGCKNCYAERMATRLQKMGVKKYSNGFKLNIHLDVMQYPFQLKRPRMIFVNSMSDLFHENLNFSFIKKIFEVMEKANWHQYQILTKRSERLKEFGQLFGKFPDNVWIGVSVENAQYKKRINDLKEINAKILFLSLEPLLGSLGYLDLKGIDWVIAGGESGMHHRLCKTEWIREIRDQCIIQNVPFFFKQWGGIRPKSQGRLLDGREWNEFPNFKIKEKKTEKIMISK